MQSSIVYGWRSLDLPYGVRHITFFFSRTSSNRESKLAQSLMGDASTFGYLKGFSKSIGSIYYCVISSHFQNLYNDNLSNQACNLPRKLNGGPFLFLLSLLKKFQGGNSRGLFCFWQQTVEDYWKSFFGNQVIGLKYEYPWTSLKIVQLANSHTAFSGINPF